MSELSVEVQIRILRAFRDCMDGNTQACDLPQLIPEVEKLILIPSPQIHAFLESTFNLPTGPESGVESPPEKKVKRRGRKSRAELEREKEEREEERRRRAEESAPGSVEVSPAKRPRRASTRRT
jgi:hypothetical protein